MLARFSRTVLLAGLCLLPAIPAAAQSTSKATLDSSETVFSVLAAIGSCGYDANSTEPVHAQVEAEIAKAVAASKEAREAGAQMCAFYRDHQQPDSARDLAQYVSLALNLGDPPKFTLKVKEADLPPDANYVLGFVPLLTRFSALANLHHIWQEHRYQYDELIARFHEPVSKMILATDVYLRLPISGLWAALSPCTWSRWPRTMLRTRRSAPDFAQRAFMQMRGWYESDHAQQFHHAEQATDKK